MRLRIYPYRMGSQSSRAIARALNILQVYPDRRYRPRRNDLIINWGNSHIPNWYTNHWLNEPRIVSNASNKLKAFMIMQEYNISHPPFLTTPETMKEHFRNYPEEIWLARTNLYGNSGEGIEILTNETPFVNALLYTKYIKKKYEYRIHVFQNEILHIQQKRKRLEFDIEDPNPYIRNLNNGWIFACNDIVIPTNDVLTQSLKVIPALGLDFGAVDIIWNEHQNKAYVLEVNTAPGLTGTTLIKYKTKFEEWR